jgi:GTP-binding protein EngB required for normal cell division
VSRQGLLRRQRTPALEDRLDALERAVAIASGRVDADLVEDARGVLARAGERLRLGSTHTVVALAGATGSGKSSLFNELAGSQLSEVGVRRPTTGVTHACVWGADDAGKLLDWIGAARRHRLDAGAAELDGLILLDLPDYDSIETTHRLEVDRLVAQVDLLVWILDPQKYADAAVHERYLRKLRSHGTVMVVVLNQVDRLSSSERERCCAHLRRLLAEDGLPGVPVLAVSAVKGTGMGDLERLLGERVGARKAAVQRLEADIRALGTSWSELCGEKTPSRPLGRAERESLLAILARAAAVEHVVVAVGKAHVHRSVVATGWPITRWVRRLRPDPLRRLRLAGPGAETKSSLAPASPVQKAGIDGALRAAAEAGSRGLPPPWPEVIKRRLFHESRALSDELDRAVGQARLDAGRPPLWWKVVGALQGVVTGLAAGGFLWLLGLFLFTYTRLPEPPTPKWEGFPVPTLLLIGGVALGLLLAVATRVCAHIGAARRRRVARRLLHQRIRSVMNDVIEEPLADELAAYEQLCDSVRLLHS